MRCYVPMVAAMSLCTSAFAGVWTSPGGHGTNYTIWVQSPSSTQVKYGGAGFEATTRTHFYNITPPPPSGAEVGYSDQVLRVSVPRVGDTRQVAVDVAVNADFFVSVPRGGVTPTPLAITLTGPGGLFPLEAGSTNAPINYTSDTVVLGADGETDANLQYVRHYEFTMAAGLDTYFYMRPALIVEPQGEGDGAPIDFFYMELTYTVTYSIVPAPASCVLAAVGALAGLPRRRR